MESLETQLERVQAAIAAIEAGAQEYYIGKSRIRKADLNILYKREADLQHAIASASGDNFYFARIKTS